MSELINNKEHRQEKLKTLIKKLHDGSNFEEVKEEFEKEFGSVHVSEITAMEQALINEGMNPEEIQKLCDVHASIFKGSIEEIHKDDKGFYPFPEGHPGHTLIIENEAIEEFISSQIVPIAEEYEKTSANSLKIELKEAMERLYSIDKHYSRKELLFFPFMEKHGITAPPQVMWGVDDEIRAKIKKSINILSDDKKDSSEAVSSVREAVEQLIEMIFKEEEILLPMVTEVFSQEDWKAIEEGSNEIGFSFINEPVKWIPKADDIENIEIKNDNNDGKSILFDAGTLLPEEINSILNTLPLDMTFVDANNRVKYFTQGKERIFDRPKTILGREVKNCHPPKSVHVVEEIVKQLMSGEKDHEDFWIKMGEMFVYIRYFAVRNKEGKYLGTLEITQNIKPIMELEGEKRLMS